MAEEQEGRIYRGRDRGFEDFWAAVQAVEGGTVSPGGAALILRISRQAVWKLIQSGRLRAWQFFEHWSLHPDYVEVSIRDVVRHGVRTGRITCRRDVPMASYLLDEEVPRALAEVDAGQQVG